MSDYSQGIIRVREHQNCIRIMKIEKKNVLVVIEPEDLINYYSDDVILIDLCRDSTYAQHHIPGAVHVSTAEIMLGMPPAVGELPSKAALNQLFSRIGLSDDRLVIVYDDEGGGWAGRFIWLLDVIGHENYAYVNGGLHAWLKAGLPTESTTNHLEPSNYQVVIHSQPVADRDYILSHLNDERVMIWDARSPEEFSGKKVFARKAGHIPGAVNFEWTRAMDSQNNYRIKSKQILQSELCELGVTADKEIITHCQTHHRSGFTYMVLRYLDFPNVKAYPGSWSDWGNHPETPVEN